MLTFSRSDFKKLFCNAYDHAKWIDAMCAVFGPLQLKAKPEELEIGLKGNDCGWFLGRFTAASQGGDMEVGVFHYRIESKSVLKSRVGLRNLVRPYVRDYSSLGAALVVFEDAKTGAWRFSFVSDLKGGETAAKRYTYVFGAADGVYNTPADRFLKLAAGRPADGFVTFEQMREAFSVEALSKEFYNRLFAWYQWAMDDERIHVTFPNKVGDRLDDRRNLNVAMIRMLTRILFCWFIKQKKLVPEGLFDVDFLTKILVAFDGKTREPFDPMSETQGTYYNAILQNLFFATLNREIIDDDGRRRAFANAKSARDVRNLYRYREMFSFGADEVERKVIALFAKVPFLNGGLFECLDKFKKFDLMQDDDEYLDGFSRNFTSYKVGAHRHYRYIAHVPNILFFNEDEKALGLINLLKAYNFTIEENAANDAEVSLDPELLGRVFENLLADYNEETQKSARNATGSFYTPREIVDYQVAESLGAYLTAAAGAIGTGGTRSVASAVREFVLNRVKPADAELCRGLEEALLKVKILDPACGSGAYPMGCLLKIVDLVDCLRDGRCDHYALKLELIDKAIYGVDIQPIAMLITKLRFFISLICDQKEITDDEKTNFGVKPLPNLETKFVAANSLISLETNDMFELEDPEVAKLRKELLSVREQHFAASTTHEKKKLRGEDELIRGKMIKRLTDIASKPDKQKLAVYRKELARAKNARANLDAASFTPHQIYQQPTLFGEPTQMTFPNLSSCEPVGRDAPIAPQSVQLAKRQKDMDRQIANLKKLIAVEEGRQMTPALKTDAANLAQWNPYDQNDVAGFFDPYWMFGLKTGFDIVIGNPPYIQLQANGGLLAKLYEKKGFETFESTGDIYCLFYERSRQILRDKGVLCFITSNKWMRTGYGKKLRGFLAVKTNPRILLDFAGEKVFESASVDTNILLAAKEENRFKTKAAIATPQCQENVVGFFEANSSSLRFDSDDQWVILSKVESELRSKVVRLGTPIKDLGILINLGIKSGLTAAFIVDQGTRDKILASCKGDKERSLTERLLQPYLRGRDITRYGKVWQGLYLVGMHNGVEDAGIEAEHISDYPSVKGFLDSFGAALSKRSDKGNTRYNLRDCAYWCDFKKPKLVWADIMRIRKVSDERFPRFSYDDEGYYTGNTCYIATGPSIKYVLGVLNSLMGRYLCSKEIVILDNGGYRMWKTYVEKVRIPAASAEQERQVSDIVDRILAAKKADLNADTSAWEDEIDQLVYRLYDLTPEEIAVVEATAKK